MHKIILPYHHDDEVARYENILDLIASFPKPAASFEFVLAASHRTTPSDRLLQHARRIAPAQHFVCPTRIAGYPAGPNAMFWDCMQKMSQDGDDGFSLWMESDMCPVSPRWLDTLDAQWRWVQENQGDEPAAVCMGLYVKPIQISVLRRSRWYKIDQRWRPRKLARPYAHMNGGSCYAKSFIHEVGANYRGAAFDIDLGGWFREHGRYAATPSIAFSRLEDIQELLDSGLPSILHGFKQDKDSFIAACRAAVSGESIFHAIPVQNPPVENLPGIIARESKMRCEDMIRGLKDHHLAQCPTLEVYRQDNQRLRSIPLNDLPGGEARSTDQAFDALRGAKAA